MEKEREAVRVSSGPLVLVVLVFGITVQWHNGRSFGGKRLVSRYFKVSTRVSEFWTMQAMRGQQRDSLQELGRKKSVKRRHVTTHNSQLTTYKSTIKTPHNAQPTRCAGSPRF